MGILKRGVQASNVGESRWRPPRHQHCEAARADIRTFHVFWGAPDDGNGATLDLLVTIGMFVDRRRRTSFLRDILFRIIEFFPHEDHSEGQKHRVETADDGELKSGDLVVGAEPLQTHLAADDAAPPSSLGSPG